MDSETANRPEPETVMQKLVERENLRKELENARRSAAEAKRAKYLQRKAGASEKRKSKNAAKARMAKASRKRNRR